MTLDQQIFWGSVFLLACLAVQIGMVVYCSLTLEKLGGCLSARRSWIYQTVLTLVTLVFVVVNHTVQVWIWAMAWVNMGVMEDWNLSLYFSMVTYSTVGYGDVVLDEGLRIFGTFASVTGVLAFGVSTAFLVAVMTRMLHHKVFDTHES